jgi:UDP-glucose 4-epimerase
MTFDKLYDLKDKRLLVTGGAGFLGSWVSTLALLHGADVTIYDIKAPVFQTFSPNKIHYHYVHENIQHGKKLDKLVKHSDLVIHLAGILGTDSTFNNLTGTLATNVIGSSHLLNACIKYQTPTVIPSVGNGWQNPYTISRECVADLCFMANEEFHSDFRVLRIMNAYGPGQHYNKSKKIIPSFIRHCEKEESIEIFGTGEQTIDLVFAADAATALLLTALSGIFPKHNPVTFGLGKPISVLNAAIKIQRLYEKSVCVSFKGKRQGEPLDSITLSDNSLFKALTGFDPTIDHEQGLSETVQWYKNHKEYLYLW